jgi:TP901 family phage tail tape measure protein
MKDIPVKVLVQQQGKDVLKSVAAELKHVADAQKTVNKASDDMGQAAQASGLKLSQWLQVGAVQASAGIGALMSMLGGLVVVLGTAGVAAAALAATLAVVSVKAAVDYERQLVRISALTGAQAELVGVWRHELLALAPVVGKVPQELAEGLYFITSAGITGASALTVLKDAALGSALGMGTTGDLAKLLTSTLNAFGTQGYDSARVMDILTETIKQGGAEASELAGVFGRVTSIAREFGVSLEEAGAFVATYTRVVPSAAEAITALRQTILNLMSPSEQTKTALGALGISADELRRSIRERGLMQTLVDLVSITKGNEEALDKLIPNVRALAGVLGTAGSQAETYARILNAIKDSQGSFAAAVDQMQRTLSFRWEQMIAHAAALKIQIGMGLAPAFEQLSRVMLPVRGGLQLVVDKLTDSQTEVGKLGKALTNNLLMQMALVIQGAGGMVRGITEVIATIIDWGVNTQKIISYLYALQAAQLDFVGANEAAFKSGLKSSEAWNKALAMESSAASFRQNGKAVQGTLNEIALGFKLAAVGHDIYGKRTDSTAAAHAKLKRDVAGALSELRRVPPVTKESEKAMKEAAKAADKLHASMAAWAGQKTIEDANEMGLAVREFGLAAVIAAGKGDEVVKMLRELNRMGIQAEGALGHLQNALKAVTLPVTIATELSFPTTQELWAAGQRAIDAQASAMQGMGQIMQLGGVDIGIFPEILEGLKDIKKETFDWGQAMQTAAAIMQVLGLRADSTVGKIVSGFVVAASAVNEFVKATSKGDKALAAMAIALAAVQIGKAIFDSLTTSPAERAARDAGIVLGMNLTEGMGEEILAMSKQLGITIKDAALLSITKLANETGRPLHTMINQVGMLMVRIKQGAVPAAAGVKELTDVFSQLNDEFRQGDLLAGRAMIGMIQAARAAGQEVPAIRAAVKESLDEAIQGAIDFFGERQHDLTGKAASDQATIFSAVFWAKVREDGIFAATEALRPAWDEMQASFAASGIRPEVIEALVAPMRELFDFFGTEFGSRVGTQLDALLRMMRGLGEAGYMTLDAFRAFGGETTRIFQDIVRETGNERLALLAVLPALAEQRRLAALYGIELDAATKELLAKAEAEGVAWPKEPIEVVVDLLKMIVELLGGKIPAAANDARNALGSVGDAINNLPTVGPRGGKNQQAQHGYVSMAPQTLDVHGTTGNPEIVAPVKQLAQQIGIGLASQLRGMIGGGDTKIEVIVQLPYGELVRTIEKEQRRFNLRTYEPSVKTFG